MGKKGGHTSKQTETCEEASSSEWQKRKMRSRRIEGLNEKSKLRQDYQRLARPEKALLASLSTHGKRRAREFLSKQMTAFDLRFKGVARQDDDRPSSTVSPLLAHHLLVLRLAASRWQVRCPWRNARFYTSNL